MAAEAKQRRLPQEAQTVKNCSHTCEHVKDDGKGHHGAARIHHSTWQITAWIARVLVPIFMWVLYSYITWDIFPSTDDRILKFLAFGFHASGLCALLSYFAVAYHGPGEVQDSELHLPSIVSAAFHLPTSSCNEDAEDIKHEWCEPCDSRRPILASHCDFCQRYLLWRVPGCHDLFLGQCIGFRNSRCQVLAINYVVFSNWALLLGTGWRMFMAEDWSSWPFFRKFFFGLFLWVTLNVFNSTLRMFLVQLIRGWPFAMRRKEFEQTASAARELEDEMRGCHCSWASREDAQQLSDALSKVLTDQGSLRGPFRLEGLRADRPELFFGERQSWKILIPGLPGGGCDDPYQPANFDLDVCSAWVSLRADLEQFTKRKQSIDVPKRNPDLVQQVMK